MTATDERARHALEGLLSGRRDEVHPDVADAVDAAMAPVRSAAPVEVLWLSVNGRRVDARLTAGALEWWLSFTVDDGGLVDLVELWERPEPFPGVPGGRALIVNGPSSVGKSTLLAAVASADRRPWVLFDELAVGDVLLQYLVWPDRAPTLRPGFLAGAAAVARAGNQIALTPGGSTQSVLERSFRGLEIITVGLDCAAPVREQRHRGRLDRWGDLLDTSMLVHADWRYDLRFDTSETAPDEIADAVLRFIGPA